MAEGRREEAWVHTSFLLAKLHNVNVVNKSDLREPRDFNPLAHTEEPAREVVSVSALKGIFRDVLPCSK